MVNNYLVGEDVKIQTKRLTQEFARLSVTVEIKTAAAVSCYLKSDGVALENFPYDFVVYLDKDKYLSKLLELGGVRVFNNEKALTLCDDKMLSYLAVSAVGIRIPKTIAGILCYQRQLPDSNFLDKIEIELGYPLVIKESYGSMGRQVYLATNRCELIETASAVITKPHLFQEYIGSSRGMDVRVIVINKKAVAWMLRKSESDFRSNLAQDGKAYRIELNDKYRLMAEKVAKVIDLDYCGVDILIGSDKEPVFCEVNANAFFTGIEKTSGVNVAGLYSEHICKEVYQAI